MVRILGDIHKWQISQIIGSIPTEMHWQNPQIRWQTNLGVTVPLHIKIRNLMYESVAIQMYIKV